MKYFLLILFLVSPCMANDVADALQKLTPTAEWTLSGDSYEGITWMDKTISKPTKSEVMAIIPQVRMEKLRKAEYPSLEERVNALIEGGKTLEDLKQRIADINAKYAIPVTAKSKTK